MPAFGRVPLFALALHRRGSPLEVGGRTFAAFAAGLPFYAGRPAESWRAPDGRLAFWWVLEEDDGTRRVRAGEGELTAVFGRPITWTDDDAAEGRPVLEPGFFARPAADWADALDGRCAVVRYDGTALEVYTDPMGAYPLYRAERDGVAWLSNSPALVEALAGRGTGDVAAALAGIVGGGWSLDGSPPIPGVARLDPTRTWRVVDGRDEPGIRLLDLEDLRSGPLDAPRAARRIRAALGALADWPGRPSIVPLTGGRDSRVVLAAALGTFGFSVRTGGGDADPDVVLARELCVRTGLPHALMGAAPGGDRWSDPVLAATVLWRLTGGTASLANGAGFPVAPWEHPRPLWHSGQGGEAARRVYGHARTAEQLARAFLARRGGRPDLLTGDARDLVRAELQGFLDEVAGFEPRDVPDLFYVLRRMGTWAGPTHAAVEPIRDVTSVLWSRRIVPLLLAGTPEERRREAFHRAVVRELAPALMSVAFQDGTDWVGRRNPQLVRARRLTGKVLRELRRRRPRRAAPSSAIVAAAEPSAPAPDPRVRLLSLTREAVAADPGHPAWAVLEGRAVEALLVLPPDALDEWRWYQVWRLATLFLPRTVPP